MRPQFKRRIQRRAAGEVQAAGGQQARDVVEALRVPGNDQHHGARIECLQRVEDQRFLALARAGEQQHRAGTQRGAQASPRLDEFRRRREVELQVADHLHTPGADLTHPLGVRRRLRQHEREVAGRLAHQVRRALRLGERLLRQPCIDQHHRHALLARDGEQVRPGLGFHPDADHRPERAQEAPHGERQVVRQVDLRHSARPLLHDRSSGLAAGRRHVGQQQTVPRIRVQQRRDQRFGGARLADRHGVHPEERTCDGTRIARPAEALAPVSAVLGLLARAPQQVERRERRREPDERRVAEAGRAHVAPAITRSIASIACAAGVGTPAPPRLATGPSPTSPTRPGS